ncbi:Fic family protein [Pseudomonas rubra]|uniref:Fic family protein n=1 Tax=Pseudomonas rubra TaxID=2942627 RepID=A0ABT5PEK4_9PSED|nr:Fic family protein [Pseudomonas rubra]MDD1016688.1 Fic family protein [Pseudomonas rubra]MDD1040924.1 Fic family protein [Pseudomonas rubra]MDD1157550.1 Fic family protein [Pseudomonas rubra]
MALTPFIPQDKAPADLQDAVDRLIQQDIELHGKIPAPLRLPMMNLLRQVNSYYSNKIEGNVTDPEDVLRSQEDNFDEDLQEIRRHIEAQKRLADEPIHKLEVCSRNAIARMHRKIYTGMSDQYLDPKLNDGGATARLVPGEFRQKDVIVGKHIPPSVEEMRSHMNWFENAYRLDRIHGLSRLFAAAGAHHRLMWIHPFLDGNGRIGRLFTDQYLKAAGMGGYGLWSMSRGFGRDVEAYYAALRAADQPRKGDLDGRCELSDSGLLVFTRYFVETALDQVQYFSSLLEPQMLGDRIDVYFELRKRGAYTNRKAQILSPLRIEARDIYKTLLYQGEQQRADIQARLGVGERITWSILAQMAGEDLINLDGCKPVTLNLSPDSIEFLFPHLW